ncbi:hypothetical protein ERD78_09390 [Allopusillimonas soli]|uniref:Uncharacterized protein n=1 Tax=Allopusillimonas soli TaxID=659016 RepID=A0A853FAT6_9BURK|nr:hypothetical protein [Allopusillimonas soli]NYT37087.1 hypothetical protein [Allopusillimonas soli]TEA75521.1 hypothetical protein ERD78_09390 [Allopusillimonas soli]
MKVWMVLLSLAAMAASWWWHARRGADGRGKVTTPRILLRSVAAGVATYFVLMACALTYLLATGRV